MRKKIKLMKIGSIDTLVLFGGGKLMVEFAKIARKKGIKPYIFAVKRHLEENIYHQPPTTLRQKLREEKINYFEETDINKNSKLKSFITEKTIGIGLGEVYTFKAETIALFKQKLFDFMVIKLPQYRGGAHFSWQILRGDKIGCWNIQMINTEMIQAVFDSGEILDKKEYKIPDSARIPDDYFNIAHKEAIKLFVKFIDDSISGKKFQLKEIDNKQSLFLPRLYTLKQGYINWSWNQEEICRFICAFDNPYAGATTFIQGRKVLLKDCSLVKTDGKFHPFISGIIYRKQDNSIFVAVKDGGLIIKNVLYNNKNIIDDLNLGSRFYTPFRYLDEALSYEAEYNANGIINK